MNNSNSIIYRFSTAPLHNSLRYLTSSKSSLSSNSISFDEQNLASFAILGIVCAFILYISDMIPTKNTNKDK
jgi:hypothetical protein